MEINRTERRKVTISLVPLIDVSIFLLIFFMLAGSIERFSIIPITPPVSETSKRMSEGHLVVLLGSHEEIIVNDEIIDMEALRTLIDKNLTGNPNKVVTVRADADVAANRVIDVMDAIKAAGGTNLSLATQTVEHVNAH